MKKLIWLALGALLLTARFALAKPDARPAESTVPKVQIAILLDTSNSMDGLINQARQQLWKIVTELSKADADGRRPKLEVALYEYGNDGLSAKKYHIRQVSAFTTDLDRISEDLFRLKTNGGEEYCGAVIHDAIKDLRWSGSDRDLKAIFIAGNEPFTQGSVPYKESCTQARHKGVVINTIFCGQREEGASSGWEDGAKVALGRYLFIDQDRAVADQPTPYDQELAELGRRVNRTYVAYGPRGQAGQVRQESVDKAAAGVGTSNMAARASAKASGLYENEDWDIVDARKNKKVDVANAPAAALPAEMRSMSADERVRYVDSKQKERDNLQSQIRDLSKKRESYLTQNQKRPKGAESLDEAMLGTIREQARAKGFHFKN